MGLLWSISVIQSKRKKAQKKSEDNCQRNSLFKRYLCKLMLMIAGWVL